MNVEKAALKMQLAQSWAKRFEEMEQSAARDGHRLEGAFDSLKQAAIAIDQHRAYYQAAVDSEELDGKQCTLAMEVITRCVGGLQNLADKTVIAQQHKQGELKGLRAVLSALEKDYNTEKAKVEAVVSLVEQDAYDARPTTSAADDIQRRREEARAEKGTKKKRRKKAAKKV